MKTTLENWVEWRKRCALGLCREETRANLQDYARRKFKWFAERYVGTSLAKRKKSDAVLDSISCWHLFETHITVGSRQDGKTLKKWLFARIAESSGEPLKVVQGGVRLLIRDVVRDYVRREGSSMLEARMNKPIVNQYGDETCLEELLAGDADTFSEVERRDLKEQATRLAERLFDDLPHVQRIAMLAKYLSISLASPLVLESARCKKSKLSKEWRKAMTAIASQVEARFDTEDQSTQLIISKMAVDCAEKMIFSWASAEKCCAKLLEYSGHFK